jgi:hypothetical protein
VAGGVLDEMNNSTHYSEVLDKNCLNSREFQQILENFKFMYYFGWTAIRLLISNLLIRV